MWTHWEAERGDGVRRRDDSVPVARALAPRADQRAALLSVGAVLALQRFAGNAAVGAAVADGAVDVVQRQPVGPKATTAHSGKAGLLETFLDPAKGPFTIQIMSLTDDIIGHAWIGVKRADGQQRTFGFWPNSITAGILGAGIILLPDPHAGEEMHEYEQVVPFSKITRVLDVVEAWQSSYYTLLGHHCATFAHEAYTKVTGENFDAMFDDSIVMWTPATLGSSIDDRKRMEAAVKAASGGRQSMIETGDGAGRAATGDNAAAQEALASTEAGQPAGPDVPAANLEDEETRAA
jgi:hypothetical protein